MIDSLVLYGEMVKLRFIFVHYITTARANNITFNADKFVFRSQDCTFLGGNLTSEEYKVDSKKIQAITEMKTSKIFIIFRAMWVNLSELPQHFQPIESTVQEGHSLHLRKSTTKQLLKHSVRRSQMHQS